MSDERRALSRGAAPGAPGTAVPLDDYGTVTTSSAEGRRLLESEDDQESESYLGPSNEMLAQLSSAHRMSVARSRHDWQRECCFRDGKRQIDYVLVEEEEKDKPNPRRLEQEHFRQKFKKHLKEAGVQLEDEIVDGEKRITTYVKIHIPWSVMCFYAEDLQLRAPLQVHPNVRKNWSEALFWACGIKNPMLLDVPNKPEYYFTCPFKTNKLNRFLNHDDHETFFATRERQMVAYEILIRTPYGQKSKAEIGITRLVETKVFAAAFCLHDGDFEVPKGQEADPESWNPRQILFEYWARWGRWYKYQPIEHIRDYLGEKIAFYFAWLGFYTTWLLPAAIVGVLVFLFGIAFGPDKEVSESCQSGDTFKMCPFCPGCPVWYLSEKCLFIKLSAILDHPGTVFYAIFMSFWAVAFLEYWKRKTAELSYQWDCMDMVDEEEPVRPAYAEKCVEYGVNPVTGVKEPVFPKNSRIKRMTTGIGVIVLMICVVVIFIFAVIMYRVLMTVVFGKSTDQKVKSQIQSIFAGVSSSFLNLLVIMLLGNVYQKLAVRITEWEMHRTQSEFDDQLIFKVFVFQFVNFYSAIIYVGFFKGRFAGIPGHYNTIFGLRQEECKDGGCYIELAQLLIVVMILKQIMGNIKEMAVPKLKSFIHRWKIGSKGKDMKLNRWEEDYEMIENEGLFDEYLEMVIQFGFITIFVTAFPLAPLFALLNNWMEIRLDAHKFICETRRSIAEKCQDIGIWFTILETIAHLSVVSNAFLIAFTSQFLPKQLYKYMHDDSLKGYADFSLAIAANGTIPEAPCRYKDFRDEDGEVSTFYWQLLCLRLLFIVVFEHVVFGICKLIDLIIPDIPETLALNVKRERYLARQALMDTDTLARADSTEQEGSKSSSAKLI